MIVQGTPVKFLCDTGACRTTIRENVPQARSSSSHVVVRAAQGAIKRVPETEPLWLRDPEGISCQLSVLLLPECPVNLLGRDGLVALHLAIMPTPDGLKIIRQKPDDIYVVHGVGKPNYYYTLDVPNKPPSSTGAHLVDEGRNSVRHVQDCMSSDNLHVTMWYSTNPDQKYKEKLDKDTPAKITVSYVYSDITANSAAAVILPSPMMAIFKQYYHPHISLCKAKNEDWKGLGGMVDKGERARDWVVTGVNTWYSASTELSKKALFWTVSVQAGVHLDKNKH